MKTLSRVPSTKLTRSNSVRIQHVLFGLPPISKRAKRAARKQFKKNKQVPNGYRLEYTMTLSAGINHSTPDIVKRQWDALDEVAEKLFHKKYFSLKSNEKSKVHELLHSEDKAPKA